MTRDDEREAMLALINKSEKKRSKRNKYGVDVSLEGRAARTYNGRVYHSLAEARRAKELDRQITAGDVISWEPQVVFPFVVNGVKIADYRADFVIKYADGSTIVEDVKGYETAVWKIKERLFKALYPDYRFLRSV